MYYLRFEDRHKVMALPNNLDPMQTDGLFYRLPFEDEDQIEPGGDYNPFQRGLRLYKGNEDFQDETTIANPGIIQLHHESGLLLNVPCYHGYKLPNSGDIRAFWNGKSWSLELVFLKAIKNHKDWEVKPIVQCRHCRSMWSYTWEDIMPFVNDPMKGRLEKYQEVLV